MTQGECVSPSRLVLDLDAPRGATRGSRDRRGRTACPLMLSRAELGGLDIWLGEDLDSTHLELG